MRIASVIPITNAAQSGELTYFTSRDISRGSLVTIEIRKKKIDAIVSEVEELGEHKDRIRKSLFTLKKIMGVKKGHVVLSEFLKSAEETAIYHATSVGSILFQSMPIVALENRTQVIKSIQRGSDSAEVLAYQAPPDERNSRYKSLSREIFAKGQSLIIVCPTVYEAKKLYASLSRGIEGYAFLMHGSLSKKKQRETWVSMLEETHPILLISTPKFMCVPRGDLGSIVIEREQSRHYKSLNRPYLDSRVLIEKYAKNLNIPLTLSDTILRVKTIYRMRKNKIVELAPLKMQYRSDAEIIEVDTRKKEDASQASMAFNPLSLELCETIAQAQKNKESVFLYVARRSLAPITYCRDCGSTYTCNNCEAPLALHEEKNKREYVCHICKDVTSADARCKLCNSWRLEPYGIGTETVLKAVEEIYSDHVFILDSDHFKNLDEAEEQINKWSKKGGVCIGTQMALPAILGKANHTAVVSLDSLFSIPDYAMNEKIFLLLTGLRVGTSGNVIVQSRNPKAEIFKFAREGNVAEFIEHELKLREKYGYPPYKTLVKLQITGAPLSIKKEEVRLLRILDKYDTSFYNSYTRGAPRRNARNILIYLPESSWPDTDLSEKLRSLPFSVSVEVDPLSIV